MDVFNGITALVQLDQSQFIVTDRNHHCLRRIALVKTGGETNWRTSTYVGRCSMEGDIDADRLRSRLAFPTEIKLYKDSLFITTNSVKIKQLNITTDLVATVYTSPRNVLRFIELGSSADEFFVTTYRGVLRIKDDEESWLAGERSSLYNNQSLSAGEFYEPSDISFLDPDVLLIADTQHHSLKAVDIVLNEVKQICVGRF